MVIQATSLTKDYVINLKGKGLKGMAKSLFKSEKKTVHAVQDVNLQMDEGELVGYIGPNGAGKSTTIKMLSGILAPTAGSVRVCGLDPQKRRIQNAMNIGAVFGQKTQLWWDLPVRETFELLRRMYNIPADRYKKNVEEFMDFLDMGPFADQAVRQLSLGQRMRAEIAASLLHDPKVLFLDEPTIGLDPVVKENIRALIKQMNRELGTTIFLTSHDVGDIEKLCRRIIIVNSGRIVLDDSMDHLKHHYLNQKIVEAKLGEETALPAAEGITLLKQKGSQVRFQVDTGRLPINEALHLIDAENLEDINISNVPLETIITDIYKAEGREEKAV